MYDVVPAFYSGIGTHGTDFIFETNPNNGCFWGQNRDGNGNCVGTVDNMDRTNPNNPININQFDSAIPFNRRAYATFGLAGDSNRIRWQNMTDSQIYQDGKGASSGTLYGSGGRVNGKSKVGLTNADIEIGYELGQSGTNKHLAFLKGMEDGSQGYIFSQYSGAWMGIEIMPECYPNDSGVYPQYRLNIDGTTKMGDNNQPIPNQVPTSSDWHPNTTLNISELGISNVKITDMTKTLMCVEVSSLANEALRHGTIYERKGGWKYEYETYQTTEVNDRPVPNTNPQLYYHSTWVHSYSPTNPVGLTTVNKFGNNRNTQHLIAYVKFLAEVNRIWADKYLNGRRVMLQSKITCDRANMGIFLDAQFTNRAYEFYHHDRRTSFLIGGFTAMSGCEWQIWDRNTDQYLDGYHGAFGLINLFKQKKSFSSTVSESYESLKPRLKWLLHKSEISYNDGSTYVTETADKYVMNSDSIPHSQAITDDGYWVGFFGRPEGIEKTSCKVRVTWDGKTYYHTITNDMWETTNPSHGSKSLADIPVVDKDFYYFIFKLNGAGGEVGNDNFYISSSTNPVINGTSVTFTAFNCNGTITWESNGTEVGTGSTLTRTMGSGETIIAYCSNGLVSNSITSTEIATDVFLFIGESNMGTRNSLDTALSGELGLKESNVRILNNDNLTLETLDIPTNSSLGETDCTPNKAWGLELPAYQFFKAGGTGKNELIIGKLAQGGARIGQFNEDFLEGYFPIVKSRINKIKELLTAEGKTPKFHIFYSQGINNAINSDLYDDDHFPNLRGSLYWREATKVFLDKLLLLTGSSTKIVMTKFFNSYKGNFGTYLNSRIDELVSWKSSNIQTVDTTDLTLSDGLHFDSTSVRTLFNRMAQKHFGTSVVIPTPTTTINPTDGTVTITQPNRVANYYKSSNGQAGIVYRHSLDFADNVWLENNYMKVGINLRGGGAIVHLSKAGSTVNLVNNDDDGGIGRQIQPDYYQKPEDFSVDGKDLSPNFPTNGYNTTLGGDDFKNVPTLLDYYVTDNGYYVKFKPLIWGIDGHISEITMEVLYKLEGNALKVSYTYTSERTDGDIVVPQEGERIIDGLSIPTLHMNKFFTKIHSYGTTGEGQTPHTINDFLPTNIPNVTNRQFSNIETNEGWVAIEAPSQNTILGVINKKCGYIRSERKNIIDENLGGTGEDATTIVEMTQSPQNIDYRIKQVRKDDAYLVFGTVEQVRAKALSL